MLQQLTLKFQSINFLQIDDCLLLTLIAITLLPGCKTPQTDVIAMMKQCDAGNQVVCNQIHPQINQPRY